jgi:thiol-disulfide isomerase/thioredoxin
MLKKIIFSAIACALLLNITMSATAQHGHEYAPIQERTINYRDWTFNSLADNRTPVNLRQWMQGKRLVLVVYYAAWCGNWRMEAPVVARLYDRYRNHGFDVVAVSNYASCDDSRAFFTTGDGMPPYTVVVESESREARDQTSHYTYRQATGDTRRWGSPYNVFLEPARTNRTGEILTERAWVANGELIEEEADRFIRERLGIR